MPLSSPETPVIRKYAVPKPAKRKLPLLSSESSVAFIVSSSKWMIPMLISSAATAPISPASSLRCTVPVESGFPSLSVSATTLSTMPTPGVRHLMPAYTSTRLRLSSGTSSHSQSRKPRISPLPFSSILAPNPASPEANPSLPNTAPARKETRKEVLSGPILLMARRVISFIARKAENTLYSLASRLSHDLSTSITERSSSPPTTYCNPFRLLSRLRFQPLPTRFVHSTAAMERFSSLRVTFVMRVSR